MSGGKSKAIKGFTLIELTVAMVIVGFMVAGFFSLFTLFLKEKQIRDMEVRIADIRAAISEYVLDEPSCSQALDPVGCTNEVLNRLTNEGDGGLDAVRYPCPASLTIPIENADFGNEICPSAAEYADPTLLTPGSQIQIGGADSGVFIIAGTDPNSIVLVGSIPTKTLEINDGSMFDEFGNRFTYAVSMNLTRTDALLNRSAAGDGQIEIVDQDNNIKTANADFFILSHGKEGTGGYTRSGILNGGGCRTVSSSDSGDALNCQWQTTPHEAKFRDQTGFGFSEGQSDTFYDDLTVYTLADDTGWWQTSNDSGQDIIAKNVANIGIGTSTPTAKVDVVGDIAASGYVKVGTASTCDVDRTGSLRYTAGTSDCALEICHEIDPATSTFDWVCVGSLVGATCTLTDGTTITDSSSVVQTCPAGQTGTFTQQCQDGLLVNVENNCLCPGNVPPQADGTCPCPPGEIAFPDGSGCGEIWTVYSGFQKAPPTCGSNHDGMGRCDSSPGGGPAGCYTGYTEHGNCIAGWNCPQDGLSSPCGGCADNCRGKTFSITDPKCVTSGNSSTSCLY